ncbi:MAG: DUF4271 domain-containing protein [Flavobacteriales bacterium]|nr:DUF4271 domain-containing protein [Flavobacteriales bacterium]
MEALQERIIGIQDWAVYFFTLAFLFLVMSKAYFPVKFYDYIRLFYTDKYWRIYKDSPSTSSGFHLLLFVTQTISFAFLLQLLLATMGWGNLYDLNLFIQIMVLLFFVILSKYFLEKIIAVTFHIEDFAEQFHFYKLSYRSYLGVILLPLVAILYFNEIIISSVLYLLIGLLLLINIALYLNSIRIFRSLIFPKFYYFILYLCALEMAPYYLVYRFLIKN